MNKSGLHNSVASDMFCNEDAGIYCDKYESQSGKNEIFDDDFGDPLDSGAGPSRFSPLYLDEEYLQDELDMDSKSSASDERRSIASSTTAKRCLFDSTDEPTIEKPNKRQKFQFKASVFEKRFKSQKTMDSRGSIAIGGNSSEEVVKQIWNYCLKYIHRAAVFNDSMHETLEASENCVPNSAPSATVWWEEEAPCFDNRNNFLSFQDKTSKRSYPPTKVDEAMLQSWISKDVVVIVYRFSDSVTNLRRMNLLEQNLLRPLEKDRAGAESLVSINKIKAQLKTNHGRYLSGDDINWGCWASWIASKPAETHEKLLQETPPEHIISLFSSVPVHSDTLLEKGRLDLQVASTINNAYSRILKDLKNDHLQIKKMSFIMGKRIALLETKHKEYDEMLRAMNNSVTAKENRFSTELAHTVADCIDVDHE